MPLDAWLIYLLAALGLSLSPGPNGLLALSHGALHGSRKTLFTLCGSALGFTAVIALSMFGIGALVASSAAWLTLLKWLGGAYLAWLGLQLWRAPPPATGASPAAAAAASGASLFRQGFLSAASNPKALLFFTAFLPLFIEPRRSLLPQFAAMAATFVLIEFLVELALASAAQRVRPWLERAGRRFNRACGGLFMAIGAALPLRD